MGSINHSRHHASYDLSLSCCRSHCRPPDCSLRARGDRGRALHPPGDRGRALRPHRARADPRGPGSHRQEQPARRRSCPVRCPRRPAAVRACPDRPGRPGRSPTVRRCPRGCRSLDWNLPQQPRPGSRLQSRRGAPGRCSRCCRHQTAAVPSSAAVFRSAAGLGAPSLFFTSGSLTNAVGAMYAKKYFNKGDKDVADEMAENIRATFRRMLEEVDWMDERTRAKALEKADKITPHIAYAEEILDDELLSEYYEGLELADDSFL